MTLIWCRHVLLVFKVSQSHTTPAILSSQPSPSTTQRQLKFKVAVSQPQPLNPASQGLAQPPRQTPHHKVVAVSIQTLSVVQELPGIVEGTLSCRSLCRFSRSLLSITQKHLLYLHETLLFHGRLVLFGSWRISCGGFYYFNDRSFVWTDTFPCYVYFSVGGSDVSSPNLRFAILSTAWHVLPPGFYIDAVLSQRFIKWAVYLTYLVTQFYGRDLSSGSCN